MILKVSPPQHPQQFQKAQQAHIIQYRPSIFPSVPLLPAYSLYRVNLRPTIQGAKRAENIRNRLQWAFKGLYQGSSITHCSTAFHSATGLEISLSGPSSLGVHSIRISFQSNIHIVCIMCNVCNIHILCNMCIMCNLHNIHIKKLVLLKPIMLFTAPFRFFWFMSFLRFFCFCCLFLCIR